MRDGMVAAWAGALTDERYIHRDGRPGRELRVRGPQGFWLARLFFDRTTLRTYQVVAASETGTETPDLARFVRSFRFLDPVSPHVYSSREDGVSVTFPGPAVTQQQHNAQNGSTNTMTMAYVDGIEHLLSVMRGGDEVAKDPEGLLDLVMAGAVRAVKGGRLTAQRRIQVAGRPAREFEVEAGSQRLIMRLIVDPATSRTYQIVLASRPQRLEPARVAAFFDSFRLLGK